MEQRQLTNCLLLLWATDIPPAALLWVATVLAVAVIWIQPQWLAEI